MREQQLKTFIQEKVSALPEDIQSKPHQYFYRSVPGKRPCGDYCTLIILSGERMSNAYIKLKGNAGATVILHSAHRSIVLVGSQAPHQ